MFGTIAQFMLNLTKTHCKYLIKENGIYICEITAGKFENSKDPSISPIIPQKDVDYWKNECQPYPDPTEKGHCPPWHILYPKCSYIITVGS